MMIKSKIMMATILAFTVSLPLQASDDKCNAGPKSGWMLKEVVVQTLTAQGYDVRKVKVDDGCYEAYAMKDGKKYELYIHPVTGEVVKTKTK